MNDMTINVRQIMEYPLKGEASSADAVLLQTGALGGPYAYTTAYGLVVGALDWPGSQLGVGIPLPGDAVDTGVIATALITPIGCNQGWNWYYNSAGAYSALAPGGAGLWCFDGTGGLRWNIAQTTGAGAPISWNELFSIDPAGYLYTASTLYVSRDPQIPQEVATKNYVDIGLADLNTTLSNAIQNIINNSVWSWNGRQGNVVLFLSDVLGVGGAPIDSPYFTGLPTAPTPAYNDSSNAIATTAWVQEWVVTLLTDFENDLETGLAGVVQSFNGRNGVVTLTLSDVTGVGGAPIASPAFTGLPTAPTPPFGNYSNEIATTAFVERGLNALEVALTQEIARIVIIDNRPPSNPRNGDLWWDSSSTMHGGALYVWYVDGDRGQWVVANSAEGAIGPPGPPGSSIKGSFDTLADLEAAFPVGNVGDAYLVQGEMYVWSPTEERWIPVGNLRGPPGVAGPPGPAGPPVHASPFPPVAPVPGEGWFNTSTHTLAFHISGIWEYLGYLRQDSFGDVGNIRDLDVGRDLDVRRNATFHGLVEFRDEVDFRERTTFSDDVDVEEALSARSLNVREKITCEDLEVTGTSSTLLRGTLTVERDSTFNRDNRFNLGSGAYTEISRYPAGVVVHAPFLIDNYDPYITRADLHCENDIYVGATLRTDEIQGRFGNDTSFPGEVRFHDQVTFYNVGGGNLLRINNSGGVYCESRVTIAGNNLTVNADVIAESLIATNAVLTNEIEPRWPSDRINVSRNLYANENLYVDGNLTVRGAFPILLRQHTGWDVIPAGSYREIYDYQLIQRRWYMARLFGPSAPTQEIVIFYNLPSGNVLTGALRIGNASNQITITNVSQYTIRVSNLYPIGAGVSVQYRLDLLDFSVTEP